MKMWWGIWRGHVWAGVVVLLALLAALLLWLSTESTTPDGRFVFGMAFIVCGVLAFCAGMVAAYHWNNKTQRQGIRQGTVVVERWRSAPPGGHK
jgi:hypothetical protein